MRLQILGNPQLMHEIQQVSNAFAFQKPALRLICYRPSQSLRLQSCQVLSGLLNFYEN
jgi:hypothetical protein